jgi:hypothetical protein
LPLRVNSSDAITSTSTNNPRSDRTTTTTTTAACGRHIARRWSTLGLWQLVWPLSKCLNRF